MRIRSSLVAVASLALAAACGGGEPEMSGESGASMADRVAQFAPVTLDFDAARSIHEMPPGSGDYAGNDGAAHASLEMGCPVD